MFTVCPKCALTLVVTAADLRVAQGYVRCGRCSNVFNALARLSEDRESAAAQSQPARPPPPKSPGTSQTTRQLADPSLTSSSIANPALADRSAPDHSPSARMRQPPDPASTGTMRIPQEPPARSSQGATPQPVAPQPLTPYPPAPSQPQAGQTPPPQPAVSPSPRYAPVQHAPLEHPATPQKPPAPQAYDDDTPIPEDALEFNPEGTDISKLFVEQPVSPEFVAATGTFKSIRLEAQSAVRDREPPANSDPADTQVDVEIDPNVLAEMVQMSHNRLAKLNLTPPESEPSDSRVPEPLPADTPAHAYTPVPSSAPAPSPIQATTTPLPKTSVASRPAAPPRQPAPPPKEPTRPAPETARASPMETAQAIQEALAPRRRPPSSESETGQPKPSFLAEMWTAGSVLLVVLLATQIVHHYRNELAATATFNGPLTSVYAVLGISLVPRWNLNAYEVRQLGASTEAEAPGQITVRASVKNGAHQSQPLPLLRVTLQDRFGNRIAARDVPPQSYLPRAIPRSSLLSAGQRIDAEMAFVDPGSNAVGFEIDACLPAPGGGIACANDSAAR